MRRVTLVLGVFDVEVKGDVIGVDRGALVCLEKGIDVMVAVGDFDSVTQAEFMRIQNHIPKIIKLTPKKDDTDFYYAYKHLCHDYDEILVVGALGGRRDHELIHIHTAMRDARIVIQDAQNRIQRLNPAMHRIAKSGYHYISFFALQDATITLEGFKYPLTKQVIDIDTTYLTSNEIVGDWATVTLTDGPVLMIQANA